MDLVEAPWRAQLGSPVDLVLGSPVDLVGSPAGRGGNHGTENRHGFLPSVVQVSRPKAFALLRARAVGPFVCERRAPTFLTQSQLFVRALSLAKPREGRFRPFDNAF